MKKVIKLDTASKRYAYALYSVAEKNNKIEEVKQEFAHIVEGFMSVPQWVSIMKNPNSDQKRKAMKFLEGVSKFNVIPEIENFFKVLIARQRTIFLQDIYKEFVNIYNVKKNIEVVVIESATKLTQAEQKKIEKFIKDNSLTAKSVELDVVINEDLISGFKFMFDAKMYDSSMQNKLENLKKTLR
jgi:F-type H+-transporting ATPase subunit delta